jgi:hypothetical protein
VLDNSDVNCVAKPDGIPLGTDAAAQCSTHATRQLVVFDTDNSRMFGRVARHGSSLHHAPARFREVNRIHP